MWIRLLVIATVGCNSVLGVHYFEPADRSDAATEDGDTSTLCQANAKQCTSDTTAVEQCASDGSSWSTIEPCVAGCTTLGGIGAHCTYLEPRWLPDICDARASGAYTATTSSFSTNGSNPIQCTGGVITQTPTNAPEICVVRRDTINIPAGVTLTVVGTRAFALVADTSVVIGGTIDLSATGGASGPGGGYTTSGALPTATTGGGGAGFATNGGNGGNAATSGGQTYEPASVGIFGGGRKGGGLTVVTEPKGGGGGGAILIAACRGSVTLESTSIIDVGGGGGQGQFDQSIGDGAYDASAGGAGGGAGGYVVIQGLTAITATGAIYAGGGGGGSSGNGVLNNTGASGGDAPRNTTAGGYGGGVSGGVAGGAGGFKNTAPGNGNVTGSYTSGGGGAAGKVSVGAPAGVTPSIDYTNVSTGYNGSFPAVTR